MSSFRKFMGLCMMCGTPAYAENNNLYMEFLWRPIPSGATVRLPTHGFVLDHKEDHQVCIAVIESDLNNAALHKLRVDIVNRDGAVVGNLVDDKFVGEKKCYSAIPDAYSGPSGMWEYKVYLDDVYAGEDEIEVARDISKALFYQDPKIPYVLGRPNYDHSINPSQWKGKLVWDIYVSSKGEVTEVKVVSAEGVGKKIEGRAITAGYMSLFPKNISGEGEGFVYRRELNFVPDN